MLMQMRFIILFAFFVHSGHAIAAEFHQLFYSGKWANAKLWLLTNRKQLTDEDYFTRHLLVGYFLNEHELCRSYCDSLKQVTGFERSLPARITYHILSSKYYQYHIKQDKALYHARQALALAAVTNDNFAYCMSYTQLANALRRSTQPAEIAQRNEYAGIAYRLASALPDSTYLYKAKVFQILAQIDIDSLAKDQYNMALKTRVLQRLKESNHVILAHHKKHPQLIHNDLLTGLACSFRSADEAIRFYQKAQAQLSELNDGNYGLLIYLAASLNHLMDAAYEAKYRQTNDEDYLNTAIVWAKQNIHLDEYKQSYEGFYLYRRYIDHYNPPPEQRIARLYLTLYNLTGNENYLSFATKYIEYFRHKPITQVGREQNLFGVLNNMALTEDGKKSEYRLKTDHTTNIITNPQHVAPFLTASQAIVGYFSYDNLAEDSVSFLVQCIQKSAVNTLVLTYPKSYIAHLSQRIYNAVDKINAAAYRVHASKAFKVLLEPALARLQPQINHLYIMQPAFFSTPLQFEGFLTDDSGTGFNDFRYVFDKYNVSYITSFTHFVSHRHKDIEVNKVGVWNPDYSSTTLAELSEVKQINKYISRLFPTQPITCNSKKHLLAQLLKGQILQVSAHASASFDNLERPKIYTALYPDSVLLDIDLEPLSTATQLVIYAACKSNVGNVQHNGIIDGFTRATLSAGAGGTICSLYNVEESVTCEMLKLFYKNLASGLPTAEALYLAKKELKKQYPNPKIWQAYIYTGSEQTFRSTLAGNSVYLFGVLIFAFAAACYGLLKADFN